MDIENVVFGDPNNDEIQSQPYIIIAQRKNVEDVRREARKNHLNVLDIIPDKSVESGYFAGDRGDDEPVDTNRVTVYIKLYKEWDKNDNTYKIMAVKTTEKAVIRQPFDLKLRNYPIAKFCWERRRSSAYGESEITYLIPNQIAINRALTASVWGLMLSGMPITIVNGDVVTEPITNDPGQVIRVYGSSEEVANAIRYVQPPTAFSQFQSVVNDLCSNTLSDSGANDAALGNLRPDNAAAIIQMREAATAPMQIYMNRFYDFIEDVARIWSDFWLNLYGNRSLKIEDRKGVRFIPFESERYKSLLITARVDVGAATMYSEAVVVSTLDSLLKMGLITFEQYLQRLPGGLIPDVTGLREDIKAAAGAGLNQGLSQGNGQTGEISSDEIMQSLKSQYPEQFDKLMQMPEEQRMQVLGQLGGNNKGDLDTEEVGDV